jgi:hypothetical protein
MLLTKNKQIGKERREGDRKEKKTEKMSGIR